MLPASTSGGRSFRLACLLRPPAAGCIRGDPVAIKFEPMVNEFEPQFTRDLALKPFDSFVVEFYDLAGFDVDQVVVMILAPLFVAGAAVAEFVALQDVRFLEQLESPVDRCNGDSRIQLDGPAIDLFDIRMIFGIREHPCDNPALPGHLEALLAAKLLDLRCKA